MSDKARAIEEILEFIHQHSEGGCPLCGTEDCPVLGDEKGYENVSSENAEEWRLDHYNDCPVVVLEHILAELQIESKNRFQKAIEEIAEAVHKAYCAERIRQGKEPYWTGGDYSKLDEPTKDYDRATVRAVLAELQTMPEALPSVPAGPPVAKVPAEGIKVPSKAAGGKPGPTELSKELADLSMEFSDCGAKPCRISNILCRAADELDRLAEENKECIEQTERTMKNCSPGDESCCCLCHKIIARKAMLKLGPSLAPFNCYFC